MTIIEQATAALDELAWMTPDEIAAKLAANGRLRCRPVVPRSIGCPLWLYLAERTGSSDHIITTDRLLFDIRSNGVRLPVTVQLFVHRFDRGCYDHLRNDQSAPA